MITRHAIGGGFEKIPNAAAHTVSLLALGILTDGLARKPGDKSPSLDDLYERKGPAAPSRRQLKDAAAELEQTGYRHRVRRRAGSAWRTEIWYHNVPVMACGEAGCRTCQERSPDPPEMRGSERDALTSENGYLPRSSDPQVFEGSEIGGVKYLPDVTT